MRTKPSKKIVKALVALATTGTVCVGAYSYYTVNNLGLFSNFILLDLNNLLDSFLLRENHLFY